MSKKLKELPIVHNTDRYYTDGSAYIGNRLGGYGVYGIMLDGTEWETNGFESDTTISRMEMYAVHLALKKGCINGRTFTVYSDSAMVVNSIVRGWLKKWVETKNIHERPNCDIWWKIYCELQNLQHQHIKFEIYHINGHRTEVEHPHVFGNHVADLLADYKNHPDYGKV